MAVVRSDERGGRKDWYSSMVRPYGENGCMIGVTGGDLLGGMREASPRD